MKNFWQKLNKNILVLAPMAGISDSAFRQMCKGYGADVVYSEMASATALVYSPKKTLEMLKFAEKERPYVVQLFGAEPAHFIEATKVVSKKIKPDGIDINFGCPVKKVTKQGAGVMLMSDFKKSKKIINNVIKSTNLPVSIKTRTKIGEKKILDFIDYINDLDIKSIMVHGRTYNQGFSGDIDFNIIKKVKEKFKGVVIGNGGINSEDDAETLIKKTNIDGIGIARGAYGKPWIFRDILSKDERLMNNDEIKKVALKHAKLAFDLKGERGVVEMRKHLCWYVNGFLNASALRRELIKVNTIKDIKKILCTG